MKTGLPARPALRLRSRNRRRNCTDAKFLPPDRARACPARLFSRLGHSIHPRPYSKAPPKNMHYNAARPIQLQWARSLPSSDFLSREMILSHDRILITHVGSLPRNEKLSDILMRQEEGAPYDARQWPTRWTRPFAMSSLTKKACIDIGNDGEQRRIDSRPMCLNACPASEASRKRRRGREFEEFPELMNYLKRRFPNPSRASRARRKRKARSNTSTSSRSGRDRRFQPDRGRVRRIFRTVHDRAFARHHFDHDAQRLLRQHDAYLDAIAREMSKEYQAIHKAGLILQIDAPDLAMDRSMMYRDLSDADFVKRCERTSRRSTRASKASRATACGCMSARQLGRPAHPRHSVGKRSCRRSTRRRSARCRSSSPIRVTRTNMLR